MTLQTPFPIVGFVPDNGVNVPVTQKNLTTNEEEMVYSAEDGSFIVDPNNLPSGFNEELGDIIRITSGDYYAEVIVDRVAFPDGREVTLTNNPITMATVIPIGAMTKFVTMERKLQGNVSVSRSGLG